MKKSKPNLENETQEKSEKKLTPQVILGIATIILIGIAIAILIAGSNAIKNGRKVKIFGFSFSVVVTESMEPTIKVNDVIIIKDYKFSEIKEDDIIVYRNTEYNIDVVHRVISVNDDGTITTKGDNNPIADSVPITEDLFRGKVVKYGNFLGIGNVLSQYRWAIIITIVLIFIYIINSELVSMVKKLKEKEENDPNKGTSNDPTLSYEERKELMRQELLKELEQGNKKVEE